MSDNVSDLETIHEDGTVTSHLDGLRRPYDEHVAFALMSASIAAQAPTKRPSTAIRVITYGAVAAVGTVAGLLAHHVV